MTMNLHCECVDGELQIRDHDSDNMDIVAIIPLTGDVEHDKKLDALAKHICRFDGESIFDQWSVDDVLSVRGNLSREKAAEVLDSVKRGFDASIGINWTVIETHADMMHSS